VDLAEQSKVAEPLTPPEPSGAILSDPSPERWVDEFGDYLFNFALARVRSWSRAEDLVQETFLAALRGRDAFVGRGSRKSWLVGILRNKILDYFRTANRESSFTDLGFYAEEESESFVANGLRKGSWLHELAPVDWSARAGESLDQEEFWKSFRSCTEKLPVNVARVFVLREVDETDSQEICSTLKISEGNLWVMLHRARLALRRCLETNWFRK
jgi:RNA polymerase sigma-70 factor (ECF subfamily)